MSIRGGLPSVADRGRADRHELPGLRLGARLGLGARRSPAESAHGVERCCVARNALQVEGGPPAPWLISVPIMSSRRGDDQTAAL